MKTLAFAIITAVALWKDSNEISVIALGAFIATLVIANIEDDVCVKFYNTNNVSKKEGGEK